jgi:hypothetical protein
MPKEGKDEERLWQTGVILGVVSAIPIFLFAGNSKNGAAGAVVTAVAAGLVLHEVGKQRRVVPNKLNQINNFFGNSGNNIQNAVENVIEGGAVIGDEVEKLFETPSKK